MADIHKASLKHNQSIVRALKYHRDHQDGEVEDYVKSLQTEISITMRETVAEWLIAVCEEEQASPALFCLTVNCLDRALSKLEIKGSQLQLLASACLLVSWKIQDHAPIPAVKIVKYTNYNVKLDELLEWEVLILSKLNWTIPSVAAVDFVDHIVQKVSNDILFDTLTRARIQSLIYQSHIDYKLARYPCHVLAAAAVLVSVKTRVAMPQPETPSLSSSCTSSPELSRLTPSLHQKSPFHVSESPIARVSRVSDSPVSRDVSPDKCSEMERLTKAIQRITFVDKSVLISCCDQLQHVTRRPVLPPSPDLGYSDTSSTGTRFSTSSPLPLAARSLFKDLEIKTPTKILDASTSLQN